MRDKRDVRDMKNVSVLSVYMSVYEEYKGLQIEWEIRTDMGTRCTDTRGKVWIGWQTYVSRRS